MQNFNDEHLSLQEELIAVKLREAEASLSLKDLRQKVADLTGQWQKHLQVPFCHHLLHFIFLLLLCFNEAMWALRGKKCYAAPGSVGDVMFF